MNADRNKKRILLIDRQSYWRQISTNALEKLGFAVGALNTYDYTPAADENPDLVLLGCARVGNEEQLLIDEVLARKQPLLICCTSFTGQTMRDLFVQGVADVVKKPYNPDNLTRIVLQAIMHSPRQEKTQYR
jgi:DNA-binding NtrC family response regulator